MKTHRPLKVIVVGAGVVGSTIAYHLAQRDAQITILDAGEPGWPASLISFAWVNARDKDPRYYHDLNRRSLDMWYRLVQRLGGDICTFGGEMRWTTTATGASVLKARVRQLQSWGYPIRALNPHEIHTLEPDVVKGEVTGGSYTESEFHVDAPAFIESCLSAAIERGAKLQRQAQVIGLKTGSDEGKTTVAAVVTNRGELPCDVVVLCGGADNAKLANYAGLNLPVGHTFGATIITEAVNPIFKRVAILYTPRDRQPAMNIRQLKNGSVMIHGGSHNESIGRNNQDVESLVEAATEYLPDLRKARIKEVRRGRRPMPKDGHPILGFPEKVPNLYLASMHSGFSLAALVGEFAATEIVDRARIDILAPFRLERFL